MKTLLLLALIVMACGAYAVNYLLNEVNEMDIAFSEFEDCCYG